MSEISQKAEIIADVTAQNLSTFWVSPVGVKSIRTRVSLAVNWMINGAPSPTLSLEFLSSLPANGTSFFPTAPDKVDGLLDSRIRLGDSARRP
jgi:hypothetical protein